MIVDLLPIDRHDLVLNLDRATVGVMPESMALHLYIGPGGRCGRGAGWAGWARARGCDLVRARLHADECGDRALGEATDLVRVRVRVRP